MMMSLSAARWCISVMKQRSNCLHFWPVQSSLRASTLAQAALDSGSRHLGAIADFGRLLPFADDAKFADLFQSGEDRLALGVVDLLPAGVIVAALHVADLREAAKNCLEERDVLEKELLLQVLRAGGDDDALAGEERRHQVGERLAGAGAGLDDQMPALGERGLHRLGHFHLSRPVFIIGMSLRQQPVSGKELPDL